MNPIILDNLNPVVFAKISSLAQKHNRSLEDEIKAILAEIAASETEQKQIKLSQVWSKIDEVRQGHGGKIFSDSAELLREDRNC
jgi:plasmid stability protein